MTIIDSSYAVMGGCNYIARHEGLLKGSHVVFPYPHNLDINKEGISLDQLNGI